MTDSLIERVAAAMWERTHDGRWDDWGDGQDESRIIHRDDARAAIAAMREPTSNQLDAGYAAISERQCDDDLAFGWRAMIDEALRKNNER